MNGNIFIDTNLLFYLYTEDPSKKYLFVKKLMNQYYENILLSTQIAGELYNSLTKKNYMSKEEAKIVIMELKSHFTMVDIEFETVLKAIDINKQYHYSYWDSAIIATAILNDCPILFSEDLQHNQYIDNQLRITNPFL